MARRKQKCGLAGTSAEHAVEFQQARHEALSAAQDATAAMRGGKCLVAGKRIDEGYVALGKMQANAQTGNELAETDRVHSAIEKADAPFEASCVRDTPATPAMSRKDGASALFRQGLSGITKRTPDLIKFDRAQVSLHGDLVPSKHRPEFTDGFDVTAVTINVWAAGVLNITCRAQNEMLMGMMETADVRKRLAAGDRLVIALSGSRFRTNFAWLRLKPEDVQALSVWLDEVESRGFGGLSPALLALSVPMGVPGVPFMGLGAATPEEIERAEARRVAREGDEPDMQQDEPFEFPEEDDLPKDPKAREAAIKKAVAEARARADAQQEELEQVVSRRPARGTSAPFVKELFGSDKLAVRQYNVNLNPKLKRKAALHRFFEYPKVLIEGERQFELINEDEQDLTLTYSEIEGAKKVAPSRRVMVRPAARAFPAAETPQVDPFQPTPQRTAEQNFEELERRLRQQTLPPTAEEQRKAEIEAVRSFPATIIDEKLARELEAKRQWEEELKKPAKVKAPKHAQYVVGASELQRYHYATNDSAAFTEELYRVPRIEDAPDEAEKLIRAQVIVANLPTKMDVGGVIFTRGQMFTVGGQLVVSYRAYKAQGAFVPHDPTPEQRAANELFLNTLEELPSARSKPEFLKPWEGAPVASLLIEPQGVEVFTKGARTPWAIPVQRLELRHFSRKPDVIVELTAGRGYRFKTTMEALRAAPVFGSKLAFEVGNFTIVLPFKQANALTAWLAKSANSGLGEFDAF